MFSDERLKNDEGKRKNESSYAKATEDELEGLEVYGPELCGADGDVTFEGVEKPSAAAGFFTIGVSATKGE